MCNNVITVTLPLSEWEQLKDSFNSMSAAVNDDQIIVVKTFLGYELGIPTYEYFGKDDAIQRLVNELKYSNERLQILRDKVIKNSDRTFLQRLFNIK